MLLRYTHKNRYTTSNVILLQYHKLIDILINTCNIIYITLHFASVINDFFLENTHIKTSCRQKPCIDNNICAILLYV